MNRDDCGADCGICDVCEVSAPETLGAMTFEPTTSVNFGSEFDPRWRA